MSFSHLFHFGQYVVFCRLPPLVSTKYRTKSLLFKLIFTDKFSDFSFFIFTFATIFNHYKVLIKVLNLTFAHFSLYFRRADT